MMFMMNPCAVLLFFLCLVTVVCLVALRLAEPAVRDCGCVVVWVSAVVVRLFAACGPKAARMPSLRWHARGREGLSACHPLPWAPTGAA